MRSVFASVVVFFACVGPAAADLYRWVDPETGSVKFSSYPPPWYGDEALQRRAPKVEVIPSRSEVVVKPETPVKRAEGTAPGKAPQPVLDKPVKEETR